MFLQRRVDKIERHPFREVWANIFRQKRDRCVWWGGKKKKAYDIPTDYVPRVCVVGLYYYCCYDDWIFMKRTRFPLYPHNSGRDTHALYYIIMFRIKFTRNSYCRTAATANQTQTPFYYILYYIRVLDGRDGRKKKKKKRFAEQIKCNGTLCFSKIAREFRRRRHNRWRRRSVAAQVRSRPGSSRPSSFY